MVFCNNPHFVFLKSPFTPKLKSEKHIVNLANTYETILFDFYKDLSLKKKKNILTSHFRLEKQPRAHMSYISENTHHL